MDSCNHKTGLILYLDIWYILQSMIQSLSSGLDRRFAVYFEGFSPKLHFLLQKMDSCKYKTGLILY